MAIHSSILAWRIPWTEEPGGLQSMGSQRVGHDGSDRHFHSLLSPMGLPGGSAGKESACSVGDLGLIPGLGRSPGGGNGYFSILAWRIPWPVQPMGSKEWDTIEQISLSLSSNLRSL